MRERRAPRWFDVPVCCDCRRELAPDDAKVSAGTGWRCPDCEYARTLAPACEFCQEKPATVYGGYPGAGGWAGRACADCAANARGFTVWEQLTPARSAVKVPA